MNADAARTAPRHAPQAGHASGVQGTLALDLATAQPGLPDTPELDPTHRALVLAPVAPHSLFDRALVLSPTTSVRLEVEGDRPATVSIDGRSAGQIDVGDAIIATAADQPARLVTFGDRNFHGILKASAMIAPCIDSVMTLVAEAIALMT